MKYGATDKGKDNLPREFFKKLAEKQKVTFPEGYAFYKIQQQPAENKPKQEQQVSQQQTETKAPEVMKEGDMILKARNKLIEVKNVKDELVLLYEGNQREAEIDHLNYFYQKLNKANTELLQARDYFSRSKTTESEAIAKEITQGNEQMKLLEAEFLKFSNKISKWEDHKTRIIAILKENAVVKVEPVATESQRIKNNWMTEETKGGDKKDIKKEPAVKVEVEKIVKVTQVEVKKEGPKPVAGGKPVVEDDLKVTKLDSPTNREPQEKGHGLQKGKALETKSMGEEFKVTRIELSTSGDLFKQQPKDFRKENLFERKAEDSEIKVTKIDTPGSGEPLKRQANEINDPKKENIVENKAAEEEKVVVPRIDLSSCGEQNQRPKARAAERGKVHSLSNSVKRLPSAPNQQNPERKLSNSEIKTEEQRLSTSEIKLTEENIEVSETKPKDQQVTTSELKQKDQHLTASETKPKEQRLMNSQIKPKEPANAKARTNSFVTPMKESRKMNTSRGVASSFKLDNASVAEKFASEMKIMEQSIRTARERSSDMDRIKEDISHSFLNRNRDPPPLPELMDNKALKSLEGYLEKLKKEKEALNRVQEQSLPISPIGSETKIKYINNLEPELIEQIANLRIQCNDYKKSLEAAKQQNEELASKLQQMHEELEIERSQNKLVSEREDREIEKVKEENRSLQDRIIKLEKQLKELQINASNQISSTNQVEVKLRETITKLSEEKKVLEDTVEQLQMQNEGLSSELTQLKSQKPAIEPQAQAQLEETIAQLKIQNEELTNELTQLKTQKPSPEPEVIPDAQVTFVKQTTPTAQDTQNTPFPRVLQRAGRFIKNVPPTLKTDDSSEEVLSHATWDNYNDDLTSDSVSNNIFGRGREVIVMNRQEVHFEENNRRYQRSRSANRARMNPQNKTEGLKSVYRYEVPSHGTNDTIFGTPHRSSRNDTYHHSPVSRKTETFGEGDSFRSQYRPSGQSSGKKARIEVEERNLSPPRGGLAEDKEESQESQPDDVENKKEASPSKYFGEEWHKDSEQVLSDVHVLKELKARLQAALSLAQFKQSCLKAKGLFFENDAMQVGMTTSIFRDLASSKNQLQIMIYYGNKLDKNITSFKTSHLGGLNLNITSKPDVVDQVIAPNRQTKQQYFVSFNGIPFGCPQLTCEGEFDGRHDKFFFHLPTVITKFMEFKYVEPFEFRLQWSKWQKKVIRTEPIALDTSLVSIATDFKKYFGHLIDFNALNEAEPAEGSKEARFGGLFELDRPGVQYLLHITVLPDKTAVFQIASQRKNHDIVRYLLQTLIFIFKQ